MYLHKNFRIISSKLKNVSTKYSSSQQRCIGIFIYNSKDSGLILSHTVNHKYYLNSVKTLSTLQLSRESLSLLTNHRTIQINQVRNISLAWLDNLAITQSKWFQSVAESGAVQKSMSLLQYIHDSLHVPWWLSIMLSTVLFRTMITFPLAIYQQYIFAKVENLRLEMNELVKELKKETNLAVRIYKWDKKKAEMMFNRSTHRLWRELIIRDNCHPFKAALLLWGQIPLWVILSISLRNMATMMPYQDIKSQLVYAELCIEGFGWLPNLVVPDHSFILPVAMAIFNILIVDINEASRVGTVKRRHKYMGYFFKSLSLLMIPIAANVPGNLVVYWTTSSLYGLLQNLILVSPSVKRVCGIPSTPSQRTEHPYPYIFNSIRQKYLFMKEKEK